MTEYLNGVKTTVVKGWELVTAETLAADAQSFTLVSGLDSDIYDYEVEVVAKKGAGAAGAIRIELNGDTTIANYDTQALYANAAAVTAARNDRNDLSYLDTQAVFSARVTQDPDGYGRASPVGQIRTGANLRMDFRFVSTASDMGAAISSLRIVGENANLLGSGSRMSLYRRRIS